MKIIGFLVLGMGLIMIIGAMFYAIPIKEIPGIDVTEFIHKIMLYEVRRDRAIGISFFGLGIALVGALVAFYKKRE